MKLTNLMRPNEWWDGKLAPLFAIGYATALQADLSLLQLLPYLLLVLLSIMIGAVYVSVINDYSDLGEDLASGKYNRQSKLTLLQRRLLVACAVIPGFVFLIFFYTEPFPTTFYFLSGVAFTFYSLQPFRLKDEGIWGVVADASGAHLFPTLTVASSVYAFAQQKPDAVWMITAGLWAFAYGLRGILRHQFTDREKDLRAGLNTYAVKWEPHAFKPVAMGILCVEIAALGLLLFLINQPLVWLVVALYLSIVAIANQVFGLRVSIVQPSVFRQYIFLSSLYQCWLPLALLAGAALQQPGVWWLLALHVLLFPRTLLQGYGNSLRLFNRLKAGRAGM